MQAAPSPSGRCCGWWNDWEQPRSSVTLPARSRHRHPRIASSSSRSPPAPPTHLAAQGAARTGRRRAGAATPPPAGRGTSMMMTTAPNAGPPPPLRRRPRADDRGLCGAHCVRGRPWTQIWRPQGKEERRTRTTTGWCREEVFKALRLASLLSLSSNATAELLKKWAGQASTDQTRDSGVFSTRFVCCFFRGGLCLVFAGQPVFYTGGCARDFRGVATGS